jgi:drug/metabolite transporter (DMT)-like permease
MKHDTAGDIRRADATGLAWTLLGVFTFSLVVARGKYLSINVGASAIQIIFMRYCGGFAAAFILACLQRQAISAFRSRHLLSHLGRAVLGASGVVLSLYAATHMPLNEASAIGLTQGVFVLVLASRSSRNR